MVIRAIIAPRILTRIDGVVTASSPFRFPKPPKSFRPMRVPEDFFPEALYCVCPCGPFTKFFRLLAHLHPLVPRLRLGTQCVAGSACEIELMTVDETRQSLESSAFPGRAWERENEKRETWVGTRCEIAGFSRLRPRNRSEQANDLARPIRGSENRLELP